MGAATDNLESDEYIHSAQKEVYGSESISAIYNLNTLKIYVQLPFLNHHCALRFFNSCIHNLFIYCSSAWGNCSNYLLSRLLLLQNVQLDCSLMPTTLNHP